MLAAGHSLRATAQALSRASSMLSCELARHGTSPVTYRAVAAPDTRTVTPVGFSTWPHWHGGRTAGDRSLSMNRCSWRGNHHSLSARHGCTGLEPPRTTNKIRNPWRPLSETRSRVDQSRQSRSIHTSARSLPFFLFMIDGDDDEGTRWSSRRRHRDGRGDADVSGGGGGYIGWGTRWTCCPHGEFRSSTPIQHVAHVPSEWARSMCLDPLFTKTVLPCTTHLVQESG